MAIEITPGLLAERLPERPSGAHKGTFGHVFVVGGSRGFTGAAKLACRAAERSGVGLVTLGIPTPLADVMAIELTETMTLPLPATTQETFARSAIEGAMAFAEKASAMALGPGISQHEDTAALVQTLAERAEIPMILDADGLNCVAKHLDSLDRAKGPRVLTPHPGEMARLTNHSTRTIQSDREGEARNFAMQFGCVLILKGQGTIVADRNGDTYINPTGNPGMATGGTGDVLSGLLGGLLAQRMKPVDAAMLAVYVHGLAGDLAAQVKTERALTASDLIEAIPWAWKELEKQNQ